MGTAHGKQESVAESVTDADKESDRQLGRYVAAVGTAGGVLGGLLGIGLTILPESTLLEKALIILACLALSAASWAGFGAWRSVPRFATASTAAGMAIICLGALSVTANSGIAHTQAQATGKSPGTAVDKAGNLVPTVTSGAASSPYASSSPSSAVSGAASSPATSNTMAQLASKWLIDLQPSTSDLLNGPWSLGGVNYAHSLGYSDCSDASATYPLNGQYRRFQAIFGVTDDAASYDQPSLELDADGNVLATRQASLNHQSSVDVDVTGVRQLTLIISNKGDCGYTAVVGNAKLIR